MNLSNKSAKKVVLFSQSPADIKYLLTIYNQYRYDYEVKIYVVGVRSNYIFLKEVLGECSIEFIKVPTIRQILFNPFKLLCSWCQLKLSN